MDKLLGTYYCDGKKDKNMDAFFEAQGFPQPIREMMRKPTTQTIQKNKDGSYKIEVSIDGQVVKTFTFKLGVPFEHVNPMGTIKSLVTMEGDKMVDTCDFAGKKGKTTTSLEDGHLVVTMAAGDKVAKRYFTKIG